MVKILIEDKSIKDHDPYELVRAFYRDEDVVVIRDISIYPNGEDLLTLNRLDNEYSVSLSRNGKVYKESMDYRDLEFFRGEKASRNNTVKYLIFKVLEQGLGRRLPWGILTGIRPVKVAKSLLDMQLSENQVIRTLKDAYLLREEKARLVCHVSMDQNRIIQSIGKDSYSLYIGIPFCPSRCSYCSFPTLISSKYSHLMKEYLDALVDELRTTSRMMDNWTLNTLYIGGGTPTSLSIDLMEILLNEIRTLFPNINELSVEAGRPDTLDKEYLQIFAKYGVDRISINPQTMNDETLRRIGRNHSSEDVKEIYLLAKNIGIPTINMDLIVGLSGETKDHMRHTIKELEFLNPDNLTVHTLAVKKGSKLRDSEKWIEIQYEELVEMLKMTAEFAARINMKPYYLYRQKQILGNFENIGYSRYDNPCHYNISIMEEMETIVGVGMGSTSKFYNKITGSIETIANFRNLKDYLHRNNLIIEKKKREIRSIEEFWK